MEFLESMCSFANVFNKELAAELWSALLPYSFTLSVFLGLLIPPFCLLFFSLYLLIYEAALGLHCRSWAFSSCSGRELLSRRGACHGGGFPCCRARALDTQTSGVVAQGSAAPRLVGSSLTRDWTHVHCVGRWILTHWTTRKCHLPAFLVSFLPCFSRLFIEQPEWLFKMHGWPGQLPM